MSSTEDVPLLQAKPTQDFRNKFEVDAAIDQAQQMIFRNLIFGAEVVEQRLRAGLVSHHEQQTSERNHEQQHRELWPAYNPNVVLPQASTEGRFQQTQALALMTDHRIGPRDALGTVNEQECWAEIGEDLMRIVA